MAESDQQCPNCGAPIDLEGLALYEGETKQTITCPGAARPDVQGCGVTLRRFRHQGAWAQWRVAQPAAAGRHRG